MNKIFDFDVPRGCTAVAVLGGVAVGAGSRARAGVRVAPDSVVRGSLVRGALPPRLLLPLPADGRVLVLPLLLLLLLLAKHTHC